MLFQTVGSNYSDGRTAQHVLARGNAKDAENLQAYLIEKFNGQAVALYHTGRAALSEAVRALTGGHGLVVVNAFTCSVVVEAVRTAGCEVVYADIDRQTLHYTPETLTTIIEKQPIAAIIIQNTLGIPVDIARFESIAKKHKIAMIEDLAHAVGGSYADGRPIGTVGQATMLSFGRDKMIDVVNGGALVLRTSQIQAQAIDPTQLPSLKNRLRDRFYPLIAWLARCLFPLRLGGVVLKLAYGLKLAVRSADAPADPTLRLPDWQAKLALKQLTALDSEIERRKIASSQYMELADFAPNPSVSFVRAAFFAANRDAVVKALKRQNFFFEDIWYDVPIAPARLYAQQNFPEQNFPTSTQVAAHIINLPTHTLVSEKQAAQIVKIVAEVAQPWR